ncbi:MAG: hypothetical protein EOP49_15455 [Sphingobacteriales bacterium]|nr:MAG: hypothetical protein EOP49_15455 [Sphingobacteriales bacterium]
MKNIKLFALVLLMAAFQSCGDMSNNTNENNHQYTDSSGMNADGTGNPDAAGAPMRNAYDTDSNSYTNGPDNAAPKSSAMDSTKSMNPNSNNGATNETSPAGATNR